MTLLGMENGGTANVLSLDGGGFFKSKLTAMGICEGRRIRKIADSGGHGPIIIEVMGSKIAIGRGMANRIMVRPAR